jgi:hypothetical protein
MNNSKITSPVLEMDHFLVRAAGRHSVAADNKCLLQIASACTARGVHKVIIDIRSLQGPISQTERYQLGDYLATVWPRHVPLAIIARPEQLTPDRFFFRMLQQRGVTAKVFFGPDGVRAWLAGQKVRTGELDSHRRGLHTLSAGNENQDDVNS